ncbi:MAG TPA: hypothetical protein P5048_01495 [Chlamydiales bacterium]|nr:hypothetical protein [Chlamydiales bacterium]
MADHTFLFNPGIWLGEGKIILNMVEEKLVFYTKWQIDKSEDKTSGIQEIQIGGISENMRNELSFYDFTKSSFIVEMSNLNIGKVVGHGVIDDQLIAWEFRDNEMNFEGFETYKKQEDGSYLVHSEYVTSDQFRTQIEGRIWQKFNEEGNYEK